MEKENRVIVSPEYLKDLDSPLIFLAGPIQGAADWQSEAIKIIHANSPDVFIASPRRNTFDKSGFNYDEQVQWESNHLKKAGERGVILFWLAKEQEVIPGRAYAQTTRFEIAEWLVRHQYTKAQIVVGFEEGFVGDRYIKKRLSDYPEILVCNTLEETCLAAIKLMK